MKLFSLMILLSSLQVHGAELIRIAVVDTGLDLYDTRFSYLLCRDATHMDFTGEGIEDKIDHGTAVTGLIKQYAGNTGYCLIILKYFSFNATPTQSTDRLLDAVKAASANGADFVNISSYGPVFSMDEYIEIKRHPEITYVVAAGNEGQDLDEPGIEQYPVGYRLPNVIGVGSLNTDGVTRAKSSNRKLGLRWEIGEHVRSTLTDYLCKDLPYFTPYTCEGASSGTSFATPIVLGKLVKERINNTK